MNASTHRGFTPSAADLLPPEGRRGPRPAQRTASRRLDVVDAVFETVPGARRAAASEKASPPLGRGPAKASMLLQTLEQALTLLSLRSFVALTGTLCLVAFLLGGQVSAGPAPTLRVEDVEARLSDMNGMRVVSVYGAVVNGSGETRRVPAITVELTGPSGLMRVQGQLAGIGPLAPGESRRFTARLPHSGGSLPQVEVSFAPTGASAR